MFVLRDIGLPPRDGSDLDAERLEESFQDLGFEVRRYNDVTCAKMTSLLRDGELKLTELLIFDMSNLFN